MYEHGTTVVRGLTFVEQLDGRRNEVWHCRVDPAGEIRAGEPVVVKLLHPAYESIFPRHLGRRARTLNRIVAGNAGWVRPTDHGYATDGRQYVSSPLYRSSLDDQIRHGSTPWFPAATIIARAASAVAAAHLHDYSFGYLRPSSILLDDDGAPHVVAFGMSTRRFDDGTAQFMAPELITTTAPLPSSDVFSLSLILASLIVGRPVDHGETSATIIDELESLTPSRIVEVIDYGLSANTRNRFADAAKLARALDAALAEQAGTVRESNGGDAPTDAMNPMVALLSEPLVGRPDVHVNGSGNGNVHGNGNGNGNVNGNGDGPAVTEPRGPLVELLSSDTADDTPTVVPFDFDHDAPTLVPFGAGSTQIDDPTDPGLTVPRHLDNDTDHFARQSRRPEVTNPPAGPAHGPLSDLVTPIPGDEADATLDHESGLQVRQEINELLDQLGRPASRARHSENDTSDPNDRKSATEDSGADHDHVDDDHDDDVGKQSGNGWARQPKPTSAGQVNRPLPRGVSDPDQSPRSAGGEPRIEPSRSTVWGDNVAHFIAVHRRRFLSSVALLGVTSAVGVAVLIGAGDLMMRNVTIADGSPVSTTTVVEGPAIERSSPLNDQAPLDGARSLSFEDIPTTRARRVAPPTTAAPTKSTASDTETTSTAVQPTVSDDPDPTTVVDPEPDKPQPTERTTTTGRTSTTERTTTERQTTQRQTTTTEATTSTTKKRKGKPPRRP